MFLECSECQAVLDANRPPAICPVCGLAGVTFSPLDDFGLAQHIAEGDEPYLLDAEVISKLPLVEAITYQVSRVTPSP